MKLLLNKANTTNKPDKYGRTPLYFAYNSQEAVKKDKKIIKYVEVIEIIEKLLQEGASPNITISNNETPLIQAISHEDLDMVKLLVERYAANINFPSHLLDTPLSKAASRNNLEIAEYLLQKGANPNAMVNRYPLIEAIQRQNLDMVKLLVENKADVNVSDGHNQIPLWEAAKTGNTQIVECLLQHGAHPTKSFLLKAVELKNLNIVKLLLKYGADVDIRNLEGDTLLSTAIKNNNLELIKILCKAEAPLVKKGDNSSAFHLAIVSALGVGAPKDQSKKCIETLITHARFLPKIASQDTFAIVTEKYPQIFCKKPKSTIPSVLALLAHNNIDNNELSMISTSTYKKILFAQVYERVTELKEILFFQNNQKQTAFQLLRTNYKNDQTYIQEIKPLLDGTKLDNDFKEFVKIFTEISNSKLNLEEFISLLDSKLKPDNLALQMYKNCALPED